MKVDKKGNIVEAIRIELYEHYLKAELFELYDFHYYLWLCEQQGVRVIKEGANQ